MDPIELQEFRKIFASVDTSDPHQLREWFESYPELITSEHCEISGKSKITVRRWKKKCGVNPVIYVEMDQEILLSHTQPPEHKPDPKPLPDIQVPENWDKYPQWILEQEEKRISHRQLSTIIGCSRFKIASISRWANQYRPIPQSIIDLLNE